MKQLKKELAERGKRAIGGTKEELQAIFVGELKGVQRVPALLTDSPVVPPASLGLARYQVLPVEPLHDLKGVIMAYDGNWSDWCRCCRWSRQLLQ